MADRTWDVGLDDPAFAEAIREQFAGFRYDDIPDEDQQIEAEFLAFAERMLMLVPACQYVWGGLNSLAQARLYFTEARRVANQ